METEHIRKTLEHYRKLRDKKIEEIAPQLAEIRGYELVIRKMADDLKEPVNMEPLNLVSDTPSANGNPANALPPTKSASRTPIAPDEFFQMSQSEAAKAYLRRIGHSISMDDLVDALRAGGAKLGGADPKRTLYVSLKANPKKEFVWPNKDQIGLPEFYQRKK